MFTTRNIFIAFGIVTALLVALYAYNLYQEAQIDARTLELQEMHGDRLSSGSSIKHLRNDPTGVYLEIDGKEVCIPLPEGYEILKEEDYPWHYARVNSPYVLESSLPLCGLINSDDAKLKDTNISLYGERIALIAITNPFINRRFSLQEFAQKKDELKKKCQKNDSYCIILYEDNSSFVAIGTRYDDIAFIKIYKLIKKSIVTIEFRRYSSSEKYKQQSIDDAIQYVMLLNRQF